MLEFEEYTVKLINLNPALEVLRGALKHLSGSLQLQFVEELIGLQKRNLARVEHDLEWFTLKFDYRNQAKPWGNSRNALERTANRLRGRCISTGTPDSSK